MIWQLAKGNWQKNDLDFEPCALSPEPCALRPAPSSQVPLLKIIIQFLFCHRQLPGIVTEPVHEILLYLIAPHTVYLARFVPAFTQPLVSKLVTKSSNLSSNNQVFHQMSRNKDYPVFLCQDNISGKHNCPADTDRCIY